MKHHKHKLQVHDVLLRVSLMVSWDSAAATGYRLRCSSRVRKVMRLGSGSERSRCIMQFSLAAGSESAAGDGERSSALPHSLSSSATHIPLTYALHEGGVEAVGQQRLRQLPEIQLQRSSDGVDVHVAQHHQDVFGVCRSRKATLKQIDHKADLNLGMISSCNVSREAAVNIFKRKKKILTAQAANC